MIYQNLEFHNVAELTDAPGLNGKMLQRYPEAVRHKLNPRGRYVSGESTGCEIRFVTEAPNLRLHLSQIRTDGAGELAFRVFKGDFEVPALPFTAIPPGGGVITLSLTALERFNGIRPDALHNHFSPDVWRIAFGRGATAVFCGLETFGVPVRPPKPEEKPRLRYLAYGSSITHSHLDGYPFVAARRLGAELCNLGLSGSCAAEGEIADFIAERDDWDILTLEIGINILNITPEEYEKRVEYMLSTIRKRHPGKPAAAITIFPTHASLLAEANDATRNFHAFNEIFRRLAARYQVTVIEGEEMLDEVTCLSGDVVHPGIFGHAVMGLHLAEKLRPLVK